MSLATLVGGLLAVGVVMTAVGFGARRAVARWLPRLSGAPARLAGIVVGLAVVVLVPELLGAIGGFRRVPVVVTLVAVGVGLGLLAGRPGPRVVDAVPVAEPVTRARRFVTVAALALAALVVAQWAGHAVAAYAAPSSGVWDGDSLWYHLPFATHFLQTGWTTRILFTNSDTLVTYFPANGEVVLGLVMMPFRRDVLVPLVNLGWLTLALSAAWVLGQRYRAGAVALAGASVALSVPVMAATQGGTARNDVMGVALLLAAAALLVHADWDPPVVTVAGLATGLALGVKLSVLIPAVILTVAVPVVAPRARRWAVTAGWLGAVVGAGAFWYVRNLVLTGNPVPTVAVRLGPVRLPTVYSEPIADSAVLDRLREHGGFSRVVLPGLRFGLTDAWWLVGGLAAAAVVAVLVLGPGRVPRMLAAVAALGSVAYVCMPNGSPWGDSDLAAANLSLNLRYAVPALALAFVVVAAVPALADPRWAGATVAVFAVPVAVGVLDRRVQRGWEWATSGGQRTAALVLVVLVVAAGSSMVALHRRAPRPVVAVVVVLGVVGLVVGADAGFRTYLGHRYRAPREGVPVNPSGVWPEFTTIRPGRVGVVGNVLQFPYAGPTLANPVRYLGVRRPDGGVRPVRSCAEWATVLQRRGIDYVVVATDFFGTNGAEVERLGGWTRGIGGTALATDENRVTVYRVPNELDPRACP